MGKILGIGLWVCIVTQGAVYGSIYLATAPAGPASDGRGRADAARAPPLRRPAGRRAPAGQAC